MTKWDAKWADVVFYDKSVVLQKQPVVRTCLDERILVAGPISSDKKAISDVPSPFSLVIRLGV